MPWREEAVVSRLRYQMHLHWQFSAALSKLLRCQAQTPASAAKHREPPTVEEKPAPEKPAARGKATVKPQDEKENTPEAKAGNQCGKPECLGRFGTVNSFQTKAFPNPRSQDAGVDHCRQQHLATSFHWNMHVKLLGAPSLDKTFLCEFCLWLRTVV